MIPNIMQITSTDLIAVYAAVVATIVLVWDILKWVISGARLRVDTRCGVFYGDSRVVETTLTDYGEQKSLADYCHIEVSNVGDQPTTILSIEATHRLKFGIQGQMFISGPGIIPHFGKSLPHVLGPGEVWSARLDMSNVRQLKERGQPIINLSTSKKVKPITVALKI